MGALQVLQNLRQQSGQNAFYSITYTTHNIESILSRVYKVQFTWCSRNSKVLGNEIAHYLGFQSTDIGKVIPENKTTIPLLQAVAFSFRFPIFSYSTYTRPPNAKTGKFTKSIDKVSLVYKYTRLLYQRKSKYYVSISCQLHTKISRFNQYLRTIEAAAFSQYHCQRGNETVHYFFFCYLLWSKHRTKIRKLPGSWCKNNSYLLGDWFDLSKDGLFERWKLNAEMITATIQFIVNTIRLNNKREMEKKSLDLASNSPSLNWDNLPLSLEAPLASLCTSRLFIWPPSILLID